MTMWDFNRFAGSVLSALLLIFGSGVAINLLHRHHAEHAGYTLPVTAPAATGSGQAEVAFDPKPVLAMLAKASAENGQASFKKCMTCHTPDKGGKNGTGPNLYGIIGRKSGTHEGFSYSDAMKKKAVDWSFESLATYLHDPKAFVPGNKMAFAGISDNGELADVLVYLRTLSDSPAPLPQ